MTPGDADSSGTRRALARPGWAGWWLLGILVVATVVRFYDLGGRALDLGEAFSLHASSRSLIDLWNAGAPVDVNQPPLYYTLLGGWSAIFGTTEVALRSLSAVLGVATVGLTFLVGRALVSTSAGLVAAGLLAVAPLHVRHSQEARMYALVAFGAALAMWGLTRWFAATHPTPANGDGTSEATGLRRMVVRVPEDARFDLGLVAYVAGMAIALLSYNGSVLFAAGMAAIAAAWWAIQGREVPGAGRRLLIAHFAIVVLWAPWVRALLDQPLFESGAAGSSIGAAARAIREIYAFFVGNRLFFLEPVILGLAALGLWRMRRRFEPLLVIGGLAVLVPVAAWVVSLADPTLTSRGLVWVTIPALVAVAAGITWFRQRYIAVIAVLVVVGFSVFGIVRYIDEFTTEAWDEVAAYVAANAATDDIVLFHANYIERPFAYYYERAAAETPTRGIPADTDEPGVGAAFTSDAVPALEAVARDHRKVWLVYGFARGTDRERLVPQTLEGLGRLVSERLFTGGIRVMEYELGSFVFERATFDVPLPTSMAFGPDGRLYVATITGQIHAFTLGADHLPVEEEVVTSLVDAYGTDRLLLGLAFDPAATADNPVLWAAHSDGPLYLAQTNSGTISRLSGPGLGEVEHVITGLPRSLANHATNSIHFGPDGRLYIAQGGNTAAGAPNDAETEFLEFEEQAMSAALLVADVHAEGFDGTCGEPGITDPDALRVMPDCDVEIYATGLRNVYDFAFHSNGSLYAPDNGLGVSGNFPTSPTPPCLGKGSVEPVAAGGQNPGQQPDVLHRVVEGAYHGHPNPARDECVFKDGSAQGVAPPADYVPPVGILGDKLAPTGTAEYTSAHFCGELQGDLLVNAWSLPDDLKRVELSDDGSEVVSVSSLVGGFADPLALAVSPDGVIYVGEGRNRVAVLVPVDQGCWSTAPSLPVELLDAAGAAVDERLYVVAGKTPDAVPQTTVYVLDTAAGSWTQAPDLPGTAVENPAVVALDGVLYVFGGSEEPFAGAVGDAAAFEPGSGSWRALAPMPTARGGAAAVALDGKIFVIGGMDAAGSSLATVEIYDPTTDSWTAGPPLQVRRDNPGAAAVDGTIYVMGGRIRNADGSVDAAVLDSVEQLDAGAASWSPGPSMPTARRTMAVGAIDGKIVVTGGEGAETVTGTFPQNEVFDPTTATWQTLAAMPTPRHGAAAAVVGGHLYVAGGGPQQGATHSAIVEIFGFTPLD